VADDGEDMVEAVTVDMEVVVVDEDMEEATAGVVAVEDVEIATGVDPVLRVVARLPGVNHARVAVHEVHDALARCPTRLGIAGQW